MNCSFSCDRLRKTQQLAWGERNIELAVDIHCVGWSSKMACSACPKLDPLSHRNVWKGCVALGRNVLQLKYMILLLWVKRTINIAIIYISWSWYCGIGKQFLLGLDIRYHFVLISWSWECVQWHFQYVYQSYLTILWFSVCNWLQNHCIVSGAYEPLIVCYHYIAKFHDLGTVCNCTDISTTIPTLVLFHFTTLDLIYLPFTHAHGGEWWHL